MKPIRMIILLTMPVFADEIDLTYNPLDIVGAGECGRCHAVELQAWQKTQHFRTYRDLPSSPAAEDIANRLDIFDITEEAACLKCHFTMRMEEPMSLSKAVSGISCEMCHGPAKGWMDLHNNLGDWKEMKDREPEEHRKSRLKAAYEQGMKPLAGTYDFVASCYACHTVPNERLVNVGGHKAGSDFEIVAWYQGEVSHNFLASEVHNAQRPRDHLQLMYIVGRMLDLEHGFRGLAQATSNETYGKAMVTRIQKARNHLTDIIRADERLHKERLDLPELKALIDQVPTHFMFNNQEAYLAVAEQIRQTAKALSERLEGDKAALQRVDRLVPLSKDYKGKIFRE